MLLTLVTFISIINFKQMPHFKIIYTIIVPSLSIISWLNASQIIVRFIHVLLSEYTFWNAKEHTSWHNPGCLSVTVYLQLWWWQSRVSIFCHFSPFMVFTKVEVFYCRDFLNLNIFTFPSTTCCLKNTLANGNRDNM